MRILCPLGAALLLSACASSVPPAVEARSVPAAAKPAEAAPQAGEPLAGRPEVRAFIQEMVARNGFGRAWLEQAFARAQARPDIVAAMDKPAEAKPWHAYRKIFLTPKRITGGADFARSNAQALARAETRYGVPAEVVTAIIGVETLYGANTGKYPVIDALSTLAFDYPRRAGYFRKELEQFLLLAREEGVDPLAPKGSYAGAMGLAQFMPSSYRKLAIDFDGDGRRNLWSDPADAIGSVANYLAQNGWKRDTRLVAVPASAQAEVPEALIARNFRAPKTLSWQAVSAWRTHGAIPTVAVPGDPRALLLSLEGETGPEPWLAFDNFYAITRYNLSPLYAMAVFQLSEEIRKAGG